MEINKNFIQVFYLKEEFDTFSKLKKNMIKISGYDYDFILKIEDIYEISGELSIDELKFIAEKLLIDRVCQKYEINSLKTNDRYRGFYVFDIWYKKGVTDSVGYTIEQSIKTFNINSVKNVRTGKRYILERNHDLFFFENIIKKLFVNSVINDYFLV